MTMAPCVRVSMAVEKGAKRAALAHVHSQTEALARTESGMSYAKKSVRPNLTALPKRKADFIEPMDCAPVTKLPDGPGWVFEIKFDGYRAIAVKADGRVNLFLRRRKSFDHHHPLIVEALAELPEGTVVDGEKLRLLKEAAETGSTRRRIRVGAGESIRAASSSDAGKTHLDDGRR